MQNSQKYKYSFLLLILVILITSFYFSNLFNWDTTGKNLILNNGFELNYKHWNIFGKGQNYITEDDSGAKIILNNNSENSFCGIVQEFENNQNELGTYQLKCNISVKILNKQNIKSAPYILLLKKNYLNQPDWINPVFLKLFSKKQVFLEFKQIVEINEPINNFIFIAGINGSIAEFSIDDIFFQPVKLSKSSLITKNILLFINIIIFLWVLYIIPKVNHKIFIILLLLTLLFGMIIPNNILKNFVKIFFDIFSLNNASYISKNFENIWSPLNLKYIEEYLTLNKIKLFAHFIGFFVTAIIITFSYNKFQFFYIILCLLTFGAYTEIFQYFTLSRLPSISSFFVNILGITLGLSFIKIWEFFMMKNINENINHNKTTLGILLRTIIFYTLFIISIPLTALLMIFASFLNYKYPFSICRIWGKLVNSILKYINNVEIIFIPSKESIKEPTLFIANHTGPWETVALMPYMPVNYTYVLKKQLLSWKYNFFALGLSTLKPIGIKRESNAGDFATMKEEGEKRFQKNIHVLIFPGGTRKPVKESIDFGPGGILLAKKLKCNLQPIFIDSECWNRGKYIKDYGVIVSGKIRIIFGKLIKKEDVIEKKAKELQVDIDEFYKSNINVYYSGN